MLSSDSQPREGALKRDEGRHHIAGKAQAIS